MKRLSEYVDLVSGSSRFRVDEDRLGQAPHYYVYNQNIHEGVDSLEASDSEDNEISTHDELTLLGEGDLVFSLISGTANVVDAEHAGYYYTQNYVRLIPKNSLNKLYFMYLLNEDSSIRKQLSIGLQGTILTRYTVSQLHELEIKNLPDVKKQEAIGKVYKLQLKRREKVRQVEEKKNRVLLQALKEVNHE